ncbi:hypothetical protein BJ878DRAFT_190959 [Calycina marina]|uniref:BZIP domain-containing protein n=1 Tax=Calycina marina TaxID=1763456 RepID=A0A9P7Z9E4_9HELO|nr:hypothetical protein BJ878DRAFT_190959 [Calycina marina]
MAPADLARIRENQRRSRARRKEYLGEVEARLQQCERLGVAASSDIQMVARRVAEENSQLRELLAKHGIGNDEVEEHLQSSKTIRPTSFGSAAVALESLLSNRAACAPSRANNGQADADSADNMNHCQRKKSFTDREVVDDDVVQNTMKDRSVAPCHENPQSATTGRIEHFEGSEGLVDTENFIPNLNNCNVVTDMITIMAGGDPNALKEELGCRPGADCEVDNQLIFSIMDRYAGDIFAM